MEHSNELIQTVILLAAAVIAVPIFKKLGLGTVLGYFTAGLLIGPYCLGLISDPEATLQIAELGVVMFLFIIGLEMNPSHLWQMRRKIFGLGSLQVGSALLTIMLVWYAIAHVSLSIAFLGSASFVMTSTAIVMSVLSERKEMASKGSNKIISILLFEDLLIVPLLASISFLSPAISNSHTPVWQSISIAIGAIVALFVIGRWLLNPIFRFLAQMNNREVMTAAALLVVLGSALLMQYSGLSMAMGAFMAGVLLSESSFRHQLEADIEPFRGLLLGLFFLAVGMSLNLHVVVNHLFIVIGMVILFMCLKGLCIYSVARLTKSSKKEAIHRTVLMSQGGEFAFVLLAAAFAEKVIDTEMNAILIAVVVLSMALTPIIILLVDSLPQTKKVEREADTIEEQNSAILVGFGRFGQIVNYILSDSGYKVTIMDLNEKMMWGISKTLGIKSYYGDASRPELLYAAGIEKAKVLIVAIDNPQKSIQIVEFAKKINPKIKIVARAYDRINTFELFDVKADDIIRETFDSAIRAGKYSLKHLGVNEELAEAIGDLYFKKDRSYMQEMAEYYDSKIPPFKNKALSQEVIRLQTDIKSKIQQLIQSNKDSSLQ